MLLSPYRAVLIKGLTLAGPTFTIMLQAGSVQCALEILAEKDLKGMTSLPFSSLVANSVVWTGYGLLKNDVTLVLPNMVGIVAGLFCFWAYSTVLGHWNMQAVTGMLALSILSGWALKNEQVALLGQVGCWLSILLLAAPLATFGRVIKEKSTASMSFTVSLAGFLNSLSWTLYGLWVSHDPMVYGPSVVGLFLTALQLALFAKYGFPPANRPKSQIEVPQIV